MEIENKSTDIVIQNLTKSVIGLQNKVTTLEKMIYEQNHLIKKLISASDKYKYAGFNINVEAEEGRRASNTTGQPMGDDNDQVYVPAREVRARRQSTATTSSSVLVELATEPVRVAETSRARTVSDNAPAASQREFVNIRPVTHHAQRDNISENIAPDTNDEREWVNVEPRRRRRAATTKAREGQGSVQLKGMDLINNGNNYTKFKAKNTTSINKGSNTSMLRIKAVERIKYLHVWRLHTDTTEDILSEYVREVVGDDSNISVNKIHHKTERRYSSFRIGVLEKNYVKLCDSNIWPKGAEYSEWMFFRKQTESQVGN